jgi:predicted TIM-barrel fold metal-dependent hydrolase
MSGRPRVDADVHCAVPEVGVLLEHVDDHWREFLTVNRFKTPPGLGLTYPDWLPMLATVGSELTLDRLREVVLADARVAILNCYYAVESFSHPYLGPALATAVNRWIADAWLEPEPRLLANAVVTPQHVDSAVKEVERIAQDERFVGVMLPARSPEGYGNRRYWPLLDALDEHDLVLTINVGGVCGAPPSPVGWPATFFEDHSIATLAFQAQIMSLVFSGIFERRPGLTVVLNETGWTWLPPLMWRMDQEWKSARREVPWLQAPPSAYVRKHVKVTTEPTDAPPDARQLEEVYEQLGTDEMLLYASDFPHTQHAGADDLLARLPADAVRAIEHDNAWRCFGLDGRAVAGSPVTQGARR